MQDLIERLEKATGPDRELDAAIECATKDAGLPDSLDMAKEGYVIRGPQAYLAPFYTASFDTARTLIPDGFYWLVSEGRTRPNEPLGGAQVFRPSYLVKPIAETEHESAIIALCISALKAHAASHSSA